MDVREKIASQAQRDVLEAYGLGKLAEEPKREMSWAPTIGGFTGAALGAVPGLLDRSMSADKATMLAALGALAGTVGGVGYERYQASQNPEYKANLKRHSGFDNYFRGGLPAYLSGLQLENEE